MGDTESIPHICNIGGRMKAIKKIVTKNSKSKMAAFYKGLSCDFKLLEEKSKQYNKKMNLEKCNICPRNCRSK